MIYGNKMYVSYPYLESFNMIFSVYAKITKRCTRPLESDAFLRSFSAWLVSLSDMCKGYI